MRSSPQASSMMRSACIKWETSSSPRYIRPQSTLYRVDRRIQEGAEGRHDHGRVRKEAVVAAWDLRDSPPQPLQLRRSFADGGRNVHGLGPDRGGILGAEKDQARAGNPRDRLGFRPALNALVERGIRRRVEACVGPFGGRISNECSGTSQHLCILAPDGWPAAAD